MKMVRINLSYFNYIFIKELCCPYCCYKNLHKNHKIIEIFDEDSLKKENITLETSTKNFDDLLQNVSLLKEKIEKEITKINNLFEKANEDLKKSYQNKHEKLIKEENDIKENLENEVTKVKEKLENFLSEANNKITLTERIKKGIEKLKQDDEKNIYKTISYISKINKNNKDMNKLSFQMMNSINFEYNEKESNIKYEKYTFNGFILKKLKISDISNTNLKISWNIETPHNNINDINKELEFILEIKQKNKDKKYKEIFKGKNLFYLVENLSPNTIYEFRICFIYKYYQSEWSYSNEIKTKDVDSNILKNCEIRDICINKIFEWTKAKNMELIYRGTRDGSSCQAFHKLCDDKGPSIVLYLNEKGHIFGGYASIPWKSNGDNKSAPDSFIFTLTNIYNIQPTKFPSKKDGKEVYHNPGFGPRFGHGRDIGNGKDFLKDNSYTNFPDTYKDILDRGKSIFTSVPNNEICDFKIKETEVFNLTF